MQGGKHRVSSEQQNQQASAPFVMSPTADSIPIGSKHTTRGWTISHVWAEQGNTEQNGTEHRSKFDIVSDSSDEFSDDQREGRRDPFLFHRGRFTSQLFLISKPNQQARHTRRADALPRFCGTPHDWTLCTFPQVASIQEVALPLPPPPNPPAHPSPHD